MLLNTYELEVQKSKFIGYFYEVKDVQEVDAILEQLKQEHPKRRHMPYAYIIGSQARKSDDKEPHNSSGMQIYNQLVMNNKDHHLLVIVRYFGGTKLGASNLLRTYLKVAKNSIIN
jgi:putative IMPACT (imprinted ancient) family translation regulator